MLSLNVVLSLIMQAKRKGKGILSNGTVYAMLMLCISDFSCENELLKCFNNEVVPKEAIRKLERYLSRFFRDGKGYPYNLISFSEFESCIGSAEKMAVYCRNLRTVLDCFIDEQKTESLVFTLLELLRNDRNVDKIVYGSGYIRKEEMFGSSAHQKCICVEALLLGMLYLCHKTADISPKTELLEYVGKRTFFTVRFSDNTSFDLEYKVDVIENMFAAARRQQQKKLRYPLELCVDGEAPGELQKNGDIFLCGVHGSGRTSLMKSIINSDDSAFIYIPLKDYTPEFHSEFSNEPCWVLLNALMKYHYQDEYRSFEMLVLSEGRDTALQQLTSLSREFRNKPVRSHSWTLLLDGLNDIDISSQETFISELEYIHKKWNNVRIIVSGCAVPKNDIFNEFIIAEIIGIPSDYINERFAESNISTELRKMLKMPALLDIYENNSDSIKTQGELLDTFFSEWQGSDTIRFLVQFALPMIAKRMLEDSSLDKLSRAEVIKLINTAVRIYIKNDYVYQSCISVKGIDKKILLESRKNHNWIDILLKNTGLMVEDDADDLSFVNRSFRDYFAAKHIINAIGIFEDGCIVAHDTENYFEEIGLSGIWFDNIDIFPEKRNVYRLIGELCREYVKKAGSEELYTKNQLDRFLDICRGLKSGYNVENIITVRKIIHNNKVFHTDFGWLNTPLLLPSDVTYSLDGEYPCDFYGCRIYRVADSDNVNDKIFRNCDFTDAVFLDMEIKEKIHQLGGIVDFEDDSFMDENYRDMILPWIKPIPRSSYTSAEI